MQFAPDDSQFSKGVLLSANSFVPTVTGLYQTTAPAINESNNTPAAVAGDTASGAAILENIAGTKKLFVGMNSTLKQWDASSGGWTNRSGTTYGTTTTGYWSFAQFGDFHLAGNGVQIMQACTSGNFADATSTAPRAKFLLVHENAVIGLNLSTNAQGWARSDTGSHLSWTATAANDADAGSLLGGVGGPITAATVFGNLAIAFKSGGMYQGQFIGSEDEKMRWTLIDAKVGCVGPRALVNCDLGLVFVSKRDIMVYDGSRPRSITQGIRKFLFTNMRFSRESTILTHDEAEKTIYVWFNGAVDFRPANAYSYNYATGKWGGLVKANDNATSFAPGSGGYIHCAVENASYMDYQALGGVATNSGGQAHAVMMQFADSANPLLANFAHQASPITRNQAPTLSTGLVGDLFTDSAVVRVYPVQDDASLQKPAPATVSITPYKSAGVSGNTVSGGVNAEGYGDVQCTTKLGTISVTWATTCGQIAVSEILTNPKTGVGNR